MKFFQQDILPKYKTFVWKPIWPNHSKDIQAFWQASNFPLPSLGILPKYKAFKENSSQVIGQGLINKNLWSGNLCFCNWWGDSKFLQYFYTTMYCSIVDILCVYILLFIFLRLKSLSQSSTNFFVESKLIRNNCRKTN